MSLVPTHIICCTPSTIYISAAVQASSMNRVYAYGVQGNNITSSSTTRRLEIQQLSTRMTILVQGTLFLIKIRVVGSGIRKIPNSEVFNVLGALSSSFKSYDVTMWASKVFWIIAAKNLPGLGRKPQVRCKISKTGIHMTIPCLFAMPKQ